MTQQTTNLMLSHLQEAAVRSYYWTSFDPEKRGAQLVKDYSEELEQDIRELKTGGADDNAINDYTKRYERLFSSYLHAKSGTFSVLITGGSNFNTRRHQKANRSEERHYELFREWRARAKKAIIRKAQPAKTYASEILRYRVELSGMQRNHEKMKDANKRIKQARQTGEDLTQYLINEMGIAPHMIDWTLKFGFGLQNNNANMKRVEERIKELEQKEALRQEAPEAEFSFSGGKVVFNYEADRIQIFFDNRPTPDELSAWKAKGLTSFNWSPSNKAWQRKITPQAISATKRMFGKLERI